MELLDKIRKGGTKTKLEKTSKLMPNDSYRLQQLTGIYFNELDDIKQVKIYQNKANKINKYG